MSFILPKIILGHNGPALTLNVIPKPNRVMVKILFSLNMCHLYILAPVECTAGGDECDAQDPADGLTVCPTAGGPCIGKSVSLYELYGNY